MLCFFNIYTRTLCWTTTLLGQPLRDKNRLTYGRRRFDIARRIHCIIRLRLFPATPESPTLENRQPDLFRSYDLPDNPATLNYSLPSVSTMVEELQNVTVHAHLENNAYVTGCHVYGNLATK